MVYSYIRVSTDKQNIENQKFEIKEYVKRQSITVDKWMEETVSGTKNVQERNLGKLLKKMKNGDILIISELSRLGRNLMQIMGILHFCTESKIKIIAIKENYELGDNINSKVLAFAFGLVAEIERNLISSRTKEALARKRAEGMVLGRPKGSCSNYLKLNGKENIIKDMLHKGRAKSAILKKVGACRSTLNKFIKSKGLEVKTMDDF